MTTPASILVEYDEGQIKMLEFTDSATEQVRYILRSIPNDETKIIDFAKLIKCRINNAQTDLSFNAFWNAFSYKVGKLVRTNNIWDTLNDVEKQAVFASIPRYHRFIKAMNQNSAYAQTWLQNRMWENDYRIR